MVHLFDILGPVMVGPSSSHTAGACRLGQMARAILGGTPEKARIKLHGSFAATGEGHGTHRAILGGLLGFAPDDLRLREAYALADEAGMEYSFERVDLGDAAHPNTAVCELEGDGEVVKVRGASVGGGRIQVTDIDGFAVDLGGDHHTLVVVADDRPGTIARVSGLCAQYDVNVATMRVDRTGRRKYALMTIETDEPAPDEAVEALLAESWLHVIRRVDRIAD